MEPTLPTREQTASELQRQLELERDDAVFLIHRDSNSVQQLSVLARDGRTSIGRAEGADLSLPFDPGVSRLHAEIEPVGNEWLLVDDGLSKNGSYVNGERVSGRRRLRSADVVRVGSTLLVFRNPIEERDGLETVIDSDLPRRHDLTAAQLAVLEALCAPLRRDSVATPATNREIATSMQVSVEAVKSHLRKLFEKFGIGDLPGTRKRIRLAELALISGAVAPRNAG